MHAVPKMGPPGGPIFGTVFRFIFVKFFASGLKKRNVLVSTEALWLMASGKATWVTVPNIYVHKRSCIFVRTGRPLLLILRLCGLIFGTAVPKMGPPGGPIFGTVFRFIFVKFFAFFLFVLGSQKWVKKRNVPFLGPCLGSFL